MEHPLAQQQAPHSFKHAAPKRVYQAPRLIKHGSMAELTAAIVKYDGPAGSVVTLG